MITLFDIRDFGARTDADDNAAAIQAAITTCSAQGGGTVVVPAGGTYVSGSIVLQSHVELHLERGATCRPAGIGS